MRVRIHLDVTWKHIQEVNMTDPTFQQPGNIDVLLGIEVYAAIMREGRRTGPPAETGFGWVICGNVQKPIDKPTVCSHVALFQAPAATSDELLKKFWEMAKTDAPMFTKKNKK